MFIVLVHVLSHLLSTLRNREIYPPGKANSPKCPLLSRVANTSISVSGSHLDIKTEMSKSILSGPFHVRMRDFVKQYEEVCIVL